MERSNYPEGYCHSSTDQSLSLTTTTILEEHPGDDNSFYGALLRHHQKMILEDDKIEVNDGETSEREILRTHDLDELGQRNSNCQNFFHGRIKGSRSSLLANSRKSTINRSPSPPSLYPTIIEGTVDGELKRQPVILLSLPSCKSNDTSAESAAHANTDNDLSRISSFYQVALIEAAEVEENNEEMELQKQKQQCDIPLEEARDSSVALDSYHLGTIRTPTRSNSKNNEMSTSTSTPISSFYRAALEDATCAEEEELFVLQQHEYNRNQQYQHAITVTDYSAKNKEANNTMHIPSPFYRSALEEAMNSEQELGVQDETKEEKEDNVVIAGTSEVGSSISQRSTAIMVHEPEMRSALVIDPNIMLDGVNRDKNRVGRSRMSSVSSSSASSHLNAPSTTVVDSPLILVRRRSNDSDPFRLQRRLSPTSSLSSTVLPVERDGIAPYQLSPSFVDDSCAISITRSSVKVCMPNSVLSTKRADAQATRRGTYLFMGKEVFHSSQDLNCSRNLPRDSEDNENDEDLRLAIYLSRFESSATSSLKSEGTVSRSLSTGGSHFVSEEESKSNHCCDRTFASCSATESNREFLISQFEAMEECRKNNYAVYGSNKQSSDESRRSSSVLTSDETLYRSSRDTTTCSLSIPSERREARSRSLLENRGAKETRQAISNGNSRVVRCKGCKGRLQAPVHYSLVYCPKCQTISPA